MSIKIAHQAFLLLAIPLCLVVIFLVALIVNLNQSEKDTDMLASAGTALVYVNLVLYDAANAAGQMLTSKFMNDNRFASDFNDTIAKLDTHRNELKAFANTENKGDRQDFNAFVALVDGFTDMFSDARNAFDSGGYLSNVRTAGKLRSFMTRVNVAGNEIVEKQVKARDVFLQQRKADSKRLQLIIESFTAILVLVASALGVLLSLTFSRRLQLLVTNTQFIAMNKPLAAPLKGSDELSLLDNVIHNLSDELALARQKERAMLDNTAEIILSLDAQLRVTQVNPAVMSVLGIADSEFFGTIVQFYVHDQDRDTTFQILERCKTGSPDATFESRLRRADGKYLFIGWNVHWSRKDQSYFCILHDFTERKEAERLKEEVLAMVSHDLRSPLTNLQVSLELISEGTFGALDQQGEKIARNAEQSVVALIAMINDLLEVERMEVGGINLALAPTSIQEIAMQAVQMLSEQADKKHVQIKCDCGDLIVSLDGDRIRRVFLNLISNAIKYAPADSAVQIGAQRLSDKQNPMVEIRIEDKGPGVAADKAELIFEKFKQASKRDELTGTGLGLAICKAIVQAHHGTIGVDSTLGQGSSFWIRLPSQA